MLIVITEYRGFEHNDPTTSEIVYSGDFDIWHRIHGPDYYDYEFKEEVRAELEQGKELFIRDCDIRRNVDHTTIKSCDTQASG